MQETQETGLNPESGRFPGGGHSNPLQYSRLENPMDRGIWWAIVHRVTKSWTWLKQLSTCIHSRWSGQGIRKLRKHKQYHVSRHKKKSSARSYDFELGEVPNTPSYSPPFYLPPVSHSAFHQPNPTASKRTRDPWFSPYRLTSLGHRRGWKRIENGSGKENRKHSVHVISVWTISSSCSRTWNRKQRDRETVIKNEYC